MIDRQTIDRIMNVANIVDVVGEFVTLKKSGVNYKGLCPFHNEKTPSFIVSPAKGYCHCFSCGKGGNTIGFLMEHEQMTYPEALRWLAKKYNIEIVEKELTAEEKQEATDRESMFIVNEWAMNYFQDIMYNDIDGKTIGLQYFRSRGFRDDIIKKFQLGYSLKGNDALAQAALKKGFQEKYIIATGLCYKNENGKLRDRYYDRVIFPWLSISGKVCAFGGRVLDSRTKGVSQKYVNSPESEIYSKSNELYGIFQAKKAIVKQDKVYMVEGYTDVISMHQCGIENVVANSGTALTNAQIRLLHRFTSNITLLYDGDEAGIHAALRGTDMLLEEGMNVKIVLLPENEDPDSFARNHTVEEYNNYINENQTDFIEFKIKVLLNNVTDPIKRSEAISSIVKSISGIPDPIKKATYIHECSSQTGIGEQVLINTMNKFISTDMEEKEKRKQREREAAIYNNNENENKNPQPTTHNPQPSTLNPQPTTHNLKPTSISDTPESLLVQEIIRHGETIIFEGIENDDGGIININVAQYIEYDLDADDMCFSNELYNTILKLAVEHSADADFKAESFFTNHPDVQINSLATQMSIERYHLSRLLKYTEDNNDIRNHVIHLIMDFKMDKYQTRIKELQAELKAHPEKAKELMAELKRCMECRNLLAKELGINIKK